MKRQEQLQQAKAEFTAGMKGQLVTPASPTTVRKQWDTGLPPVERRGPIFAIGEIVELKGAKFKVQSLEGTRIILKSVPKQFADK